MGEELSSSLILVLVLVLLVYIVSGVIFGFLTNKAYKDRGYYNENGFWLGFFLGFKGWFLACSKPDISWKAQSDAEEKNEFLEKLQGTENNQKNDDWICSCGNHNSPNQIACSCGKTKY